MGELAELHIEVACRPEAAQNGLGRLARAHERRGELAPEQSERGIDAPRGDAQLMQLFRILSEARPRLMPAPGSEQAAQLRERHGRRRGREIEGVGALGRHGRRRGRRIGFASVYLLWLRGVRG